MSIYPAHSDVVAVPRGRSKPAALAGEPLLEELPQPDARLRHDRALVGRLNDFGERGLGLLLGSGVEVGEDGQDPAVAGAVGGEPQLREDGADDRLDGLHAEM